MLAATPDKLSLTPRSRVVGGDDQLHCLLTTMHDAMAKPQMPSHCARVHPK